MSVLPVQPVVQRQRMQIFTKLHVDYSYSQAQSEALSIVSYVGCVISIACLSFTIIAMVVLRYVGLWDTCTHLVSFIISYL